MYSPAQLYMDRAALTPTTSLSKRDDWVENVAKLCSAAGWSIRASGTTFTVDTQNTFILSFQVFADPGGLDDDFWRITRNDNGQFVHVIDRPKTSNGYQPPGIVLQTNSTEPVVNHGVIVAAIMLLLADKGAQIVSSTPLSTRIALTKSGRNDFAVNLTIGSSLRTGTTDAQSYAGYVCTSQPSRKRYLRGGAIETVGDDNYVSIYLTSKVEGGGDFFNNQIHVAGAKNFAEYAVDTPILANGEQSASTFGRTTVEAVGSRGLDRLGQLDIARTVAFANPYQLILHSDIDLVKPAFMFASALKLVDLREDTADALPVTAANIYASRTSGNNNNNCFRRTGFIDSEVKRIEVNSKAFFGQMANASAQPQLVLFQTLADRAASKFGCLWAGSIGEVCSPWIMMSPRANGTGFVAGQLWDAMTIYERTPEPTMNVFQWDGQPWIRYTKDAQSIAAGEVPFTLCLRANRKFVPPH